MYLRKEHADSIKQGYNNKVLYNVKNDINYMKYLVDELQYKQNDNDYYILLSILYEKSCDLDNLLTSASDLVDDSVNTEIYVEFTQNLGFFRKVQDILEKNNLINEGSFVK